MSQENVEVVRHIYEAWNAGDMGLEHFHVDVELHQLASLFDTAGVFHGHDGVIAAGRELLAGLSDLRWEAQDFVAGPDGQVVVPVAIQGIGRLSGIPVSRHAAHVWTIQDGLAIRWMAYEDLREARAAMGLPE